jgi:hypothetical protein
MCYWLTEGLVARGHEVTFFAAGKDNTRAQFVQTFEDPRVIVSERRSRCSAFDGRPARYRHAQAGHRPRPHANRSPGCSPV